MSPLPVFSPQQEFERLYVRPKAGRTLIVGSFITKNKVDRRAMHADAVGIDMRDGPGVDHVVDASEPEVLELGRFDHIECTSVLEHAHRPWLVAQNLERLLVPGGTLYLTVPFVWRVHDYPSDYWRFTANGVLEMFPSIEWSKLLYGSDGLREDFDTIGERDARGYRSFLRTEVLGFGRRA